MERTSEIILKFWKVRAWCKWRQHFSVFGLISVQLWPSIVILFFLNFKDRFRATLSYLWWLLCVYQRIFLLEWNWIMMSFPSRICGGPSLWHQLAMWGQIHQAQQYLAMQCVLPASQDWILFYVAPIPPDEIWFIEWLDHFHCWSRCICRVRGDGRNVYFQHG